ncbi:MAG TPA: DNA primase [Acidimicrobiales bacterium]|nr:DNA primase [Acidimicrobiales bacterium]
MSEERGTGRILDASIAEVREKTDPVHVISQRTALKRSGSQWMGLCPFHAEKTPSFSVNGEAGLWHCFGCGEGGDIIDFVIKVEGLRFVDAVAFLADRAGVTLQYDDPSGELSARHKRTRAALNALHQAADFYHHTLLHEPAGAAARAYLAERGVTAESIEKFRLGFSPAAGTALAATLKVANDVFEYAGLGQVHQGRQRDFFRGRLMFPITDVAGAVIAFGARRMPNDSDGPKYRNSPESELYQKRHVVYALDLAKQSIVQAGQSVLCEGYTDVIACHQHGVTNAVAACGTSVTDDQLRRLAKFAPRIVLALDADTAGTNGMRRLFDAEARLGLDLAVLRLAGNADPASALEADPEAMSDAIAAARPVLATRVDDALTAGDLSTPEGRVRAADAALAAVAEHPNQLTRDEYVAVIAARTNLPANRLRVPRPGAEPVSDAAPASGQRHEPPAVEMEALRVIAATGDAAGFPAALFSDDDVAAAADLIAERGVTQAAADAEGRVAELLRRAATGTPDATAAEVRGRLADAAAGERLAAMRHRLDAPDADTAHLSRLMSSIARARDDVRRNGAAADHALIAWLEDPGDA